MATDFKADTRSPVFPELRGLINKTAGVVPTLRTSQVGAKSSTAAPMGNHIWRLPNGHRLVHLAPKEIGADLPLAAVNEGVDFLI